MIVDRKPHILKGNKTSGYPRNMIFFDVESRLEKDGVLTHHKPYLWVGFWHYKNVGKKCKPKEQWFSATNAEDFWEWVCSKVSAKEKLYMFAHNPTYDLVAGRAFPVLRSKGYKITRYYENGRTFILEFRSGNRTIMVLNVGNFYQGSVADIGKAFGLPKLELDYENPDFEQALVYCKRDVEIIAKAMLAWIDFCKENDLGCFGYTAPKQSFNAFRHRFMKHQIYIHSNKRAITLERECYYGGRTEAFFVCSLGREKVITLDVNSMYPAVMRNGEFPTKLVTIRSDISPKGLKFALKNYLVCAKVRVRTSIPCLPCRVNGRLIFPVGEFVTVLPTPEVYLAFSFGEVLSVEECAFYEHAPIFADFVEFFYEARLQAKSEGNKSKDLLFKLIMNSLYGKFGQKGSKWEVVGHVDSEEVFYERVFSLSEGRWITYKQFGGVILEGKEEKEAYDSFPAIASHVTGYARRKLFEYILKAGFENVYYCDTDSLFVNERGLENLKDYLNDKDLGYLKYEGVKEELVTVFPHISTLIRHNTVDRYFNIDREKELKRIYLKGWVTKGGRVVPLELEVTNGKNRVLPWEETSYARAGMELANEVQKEWLAKEYA